jgi:hypothetical protein
MNPHPVLRGVTWIFSWLVPNDHREALMGDLEEEYALRAKAGSSAAALGWYLKQILASISPLLWMRLTRAAWLSTLGAALLAYCAVAVVDFMVKRVILSWTANGVLPPYAVGLVISFLTVVLIGYFAEQFRRRAAIVLGAMVMMTVVVMTMGMTGDSPLWYRAAWWLIGPAAAVIGSALPSLRRDRS